ncbi:MAG: metal ABC transporter substrate-binding protein [Acidimicrobiia bacterium]
MRKMRGAQGTTAVLVMWMVTITGCGAHAGVDRSRPSAVVAFFPIAATVGALGGPRLVVRDLTPPGVEPHDLEPTTDQVDAILDADFVAVMGHGFQPAVERAAAHRDRNTVVVLDRLSQPSDPHVWLDPPTMVRVTRILAAGLGRAEPRLRATIGAGLQSTLASLRSLDIEFRNGLRQCDRRMFVTAHDAFGRLARRYGLRQVAIAGIDPEQDPDPRRLADLADLVRREHVTTVFTEELVSPRVAETLARETGARTRVLNPIESPPRAGKGFAGYLAAMRANLVGLRAALGCR